jgi:hypothetical protein
LILDRHFKWRFLGINTFILRLKFMSDFLPSFFHSTRWKSWIILSFLVSRIFFVWILFTRIPSEIEFFDINLTKNSRLLHHAIHSPRFYRKPYSTLVFKIL